MSYPSKRLNYFSAAVIAFAIAIALATPKVGAAELGRTSGTSRLATTGAQRNGAAPAVIDPNQASRIQVANTLRGSPIGADSVVLAGKVSDQVATNGLVARGKKNAEMTTKYADHQADISLPGCKLLKKHVNASCYGLKDGFSGGPTLIGRFNPMLMTAAYPDSSQKGNILIVHDPKTGISRAITVTDWGPSKKLQARPYNRAIDLSYAAIDKFGYRCPALMMDIEIHQCPMTSVSKIKTPKSSGQVSTQQSKVPPAS